jgi:diguanylate cyclase (GGDEF)-like protein
MQSNFLEIFQEISKKNKAYWFIFSLFFVLFIGVADYITGSEISLSIFYMIPISIATLLSGRVGGSIASLFSATIWLLADLTAGSHYSNWVLPYWNAFVRLGYFMLHTWLLSYLQILIQEQRLKALVDPLTGAYNWRYFEEFANKELERERRSKKPLTIAYFDLDNFKHVNDTLGHEIGDQLLKTVTEFIQGQLRPSDIFSRLGGDEFVLLLSEAGYIEAATVLKRIKDVVISEINNKGWPVTLSIGAVTYTDLPPSINPMIKRADDLMYSVKHDGKNDLIHIQWPESLE